MELLLLLLLQIEALKSAGVDEVILAINYQPEVQYSTMLAPSLTWSNFKQSLHLHSSTTVLSEEGSSDFNFWVFSCQSLSVFFLLRFCRMQRFLCCVCVCVCGRGCCGTNPMTRRLAGDDELSGGVWAKAGHQDHMLTGDGTHGNSRSISIGQRQARRWIRRSFLRLEQRCHQRVSLEADDRIPSQPWRWSHHHGHQGNNQPNPTQPTSQLSLSLSLSSPELLARRSEADMWIWVVVLYCPRLISELATRSQVQR